MKNGENIMKKFVALLLALVMALSLVACGDKTDDSSNNDDNSTNNDTPQVDSSEYALKTQITGMTFDGLTGDGMTWDASGAVSKAPKAVVIKDGAYVSAE